MTKQGKRAVTVCSTAFQTLGRAQARALQQARRATRQLPGARAREHRGPARLRLEVSLPEPGLLPDLAHEVARQIDPRIPEWVQEIILRALEVDPARRYQSAAQMVFDLQHPLQVRLTDRAHKMAQDGALEVFRRWRAMRRVRCDRICGLL